MDYKCFGDVLVFDTTYKTNAYRKPLVMLVGINNHYMTIVFACALLSDETTDTYVWVLETLFECMDGKKPISVVTDGDPSMQKAIGLANPDARHRLCSWHLQGNVKINVNSLEFRDGFNKCMTEVQTVNQRNRERGGFFVHGSEEGENGPTFNIESYSVEGKRWMCYLASFTDEAFNDIRHMIAEVTEQLELAWASKVGTQDDVEEVGSKKVSSQLFNAKDPVRTRTKGATAGGTSLKGAPRRCGHCRAFGHNVSTSPKRRNEGAHKNEPKKKKKRGSTNEEGPPVELFSVEGSLGDKSPGTMELSASD